MKIFISHASQAKPIVKTMIKYLPANISTWLDENNLIWGEHLSPTFRTAIKTDVDYVILFINELAVRSEWVRKEVNWALEREQELKRTFLVPVVLRSGNEEIGDYFPEISERKNIQVIDYSEFGLKTAADQLTAGLFALICEDLNRMQKPKTLKTAQTIDRADVMLSEIAMLVRKLVFPHRQENPISVISLYELIREYNDERLTQCEFESLLNIITQRNLIPGLSYDGYELFLIEEHSLWKFELNHDKKVNIARKAASYIRNNMKIFIDAGSTTAEIVRIICRRIEARALSRVTIVTTSINHADMISDCCVKMGFDDEFSAVELYIPAGKVRPATQAIVSINSETNEIVALAEQLGGFDLAFIGINGLTLAAGLTTYSNKEALGKVAGYQMSKKRIFVCDDSKCGIVLEHKVADFSDDVIIILNHNPENSKATEIESQFPNKVILAYTEGGEA